MYCFALGLLAAFAVREADGATEPPRTAPARRVELSATPLCHESSVASICSVRTVTSTALQQMSGDAQRRGQRRALARAQQASAFGLSHAPGSTKGRQRGATEHVHWAGRRRATMRSSKKGEREAAPQLGRGQTQGCARVRWVCPRPLWEALRVGSPHTGFE